MILGPSYTRIKQPRSDPSKQSPRESLCCVPVTLVLILAACACLTSSVEKNLIIELSGLTHFQEAFNHIDEYLLGIGVTLTFQIYCKAALGEGKDKNYQEQG